MLVAMLKVNSSNNSNDAVDVCDSCSVFLYDMRLNQLVAKVFNGDVTESDSRPVSDIRTCCIIVFVSLVIVNFLLCSQLSDSCCMLSAHVLFGCSVEL